MQWQEELIRNAEGKVYRIKTTYLIIQIKQYN